MKIYDVTASRFSLKHKAIISFKVQHKNENTTVLGYINICFRFLLIRPNTSNFSKHNLVRSVVLLRPAWLRVLVTLLEIQGVGTAGFLWNCGYKVVSPPSEGWALAGVLRSSWRIACHQCSVNEHGRCLLLLGYIHLCISAFTDFLHHL